MLATAMRVAGLDPGIDPRIQGRRPPDDHRSAAWMAGSRPGMTGRGS